MKSKLLSSKLSWATFLHKLILSVLVRNKKLIRNKYLTFVLVGQVETKPTKLSCFLNKIDFTRLLKRESR